MAPRTPSVIEPFVFEAVPQRVVFGSGTLATVGRELERLGCSRALVLTSPTRSGRGPDLADALGSRCAGTFAGAVMHTPIDVTAAALTRVREIDADALVALGGGSAIGLGKAIALRTDLPQIAVPTTYAGSEATPILGETEHGRKTTVRDARVLPEVIVYDVDLTLALPIDTSVASGLNAIAHGVEALYARDRNPIVTMLAERGISALTDALPAIRRDSSDRLARTEALFGAWTCGSCLAMAGMALHHKICHALGGSFELPHAATHAVVLPHATAYNERSAAAQLLPLARLFGTATAAEGLWSLARSLGAPAALSRLGLKEADLDRAVSLTLQTPFWNPHPLSDRDVRAILDDAFHGRTPGTSLTG